MKALGVDVDRFDTAFDLNLYGGLGLTQAVFFDRENFGADRLVTAIRSAPAPTRHLARQRR